MPDDLRKRPWRRNKAHDLNLATWNVRSGTLKKLWWLDDVEADIKAFCVKTCRIKAQDRKQWSAIVRVDKAKLKENMMMMIKLSSLTITTQAQQKHMFQDWAECSAAFRTKLAHWCWCMRLTCTAEVLASNSVTSVLMKQTDAHQGKAVLWTFSPLRESALYQFTDNNLKGTYWIHYEYYKTSSQLWIRKVSTMAALGPHLASH
jgi:hypothetical protein